MQILALETTSATCSVALRHDDAVFEDTRTVERLHNRVLLEMIDRACATTRVDRRRFDLVAFGAGPGSFTGVRMAAAVTQGIAYGCGARVCPVSSSAAAARVAAARLPDAEGVIVSTRSRRDAYYLAAYRLGDGGVTRLVDDALHEAAPGWVREHPDFPVVGDEPPWRVPGAFRYAGAMQVGAGVILELGLAAWRSGATLPPESALPRYVSGDHPWRPTTAGVRHESGS